MNSSDVIAIASVVVAILALFSTAWQAWLAHSHSKLSVRPLLTWSTSRVRHDNSFDVIFTLSNKGIGPAVVRERYFTRDGSNFQSSDSTRSAVDVLTAELLSPNWRCNIKTQALPGVDTAILPGEQIVIAHLAFQAEVFSEPERLNQLLDRVGFVVIYEDLYRERVIFKT